MRFVTVALAALFVSPAAAQPVTSPSASCEVRFVRTPDDVRHVIERWLAAEPRCSTSIDLRVLATEDGYYLLAQRDDGRIHERVVPDAQSAGVLVASWVADDWVETPPRPPVIAPRPLIVDPFAGQPERGIAAHGAASTPSTGRWLSLAGMIRAGGAGGGGIRAELDVLRRGAWTVGAAVSISESTDPTFTPDGSPAYYGTRDLKAIALLARSATFGRWQLRFAAGAGVLRTASGLVAYSYSGNMGGAVEGVTIVSPAAEASALVTRRIGASWAIMAGPVVTLTQQDLLTLDPYSWEPKMTIATRESELMFVAGIRYSL